MSKIIVASSLLKAVQQALVMSSKSCSMMDDLGNINFLTCIHVVVAGFFFFVLVFWFFRCFFVVFLFAGGGGGGGSVASKPSFLKLTYS